MEGGNGELAATGAHPRTILLTGVDALTASERRVGHLAAAGHGNRDIAQALFVAVARARGAAGGDNSGLVGSVQL